MEPNIEYSDKIVFFNNSGTRLELFPYNELLKDIGLKAEENPFPTTFNGVTHAFNAKSKDEVDFVFKKALKNGAKDIKQPVWGDWGGYSGYFSDPDNYLWEVAYSDSWQFDNDDMLIIE